MLNKYEDIAKESKIISLIKSNARDFAFNAIEAFLNGDYTQEKKIILNDEGPYGIVKRLYFYHYFVNIALAPLDKKPRKISYEELNKEIFAKVAQFYEFLGQKKPVRSLISDDVLYESSFKSQFDNKISHIFSYVANIISFLEDESTTLLVIKVNSIELDEKEVL